MAAPPTKPRAALKHTFRSAPRCADFCCTTHKAACGIETSQNFHLERGGFLAAPPTKPRAALKPPAIGELFNQHRRCTTHKAACGIETSNSVNGSSSISSCTTHKAACGMGAPIGSLRSPLPPHRRGKLILRDSARKRSLTKPPLRERGRGTAKRWWGRKGIATCGDLL